MGEVLTTGNYEIIFASSFKLAPFFPVTNFDTQFLMF